MDPLSAADAERVIEGLRTFPVSDIGSDAWLEQHEVIERLNLQSHANAAGNRDDFVLAGLLTFDKLPLLVHELCALDIFRRYVLPRFVDAAEEAAAAAAAAGAKPPRASSSRLYFCLYHEATLVNLLECVLYHDYAAEALHEAAIDLVDYVAARVEELAGGAYARPPAAASDGGVRQQVAGWLHDIGFSASVACVSLLRYVCEHLPKLQLSVMARVIDRHDALLLQVPLIENPPWVRRGPPPASSWQKWVGNAWVDVEARDLLKLSPSEGQPWLALLALAMEPEVRKRYALHSHRKGTLLRVRKYLNAVLLDQLPPLAGLQRFLDELQLLAVPEPTEAKQAGLLLEAAPALHDALLRQAASDARAAAAAGGSVSRRVAAPAAASSARAPPAPQLLDAPGPEASGAASLLRITAEARARPAAEAAASAAASGGAARRSGDAEPAEWRALAERMAAAHFPPEGGPGSASGPLARLADLYHSDALEGLLGPPKCNRCGAEAPKRCSRCRNVWYCGRACQVADWDAHKVVCDVVHAAGAAAAGE